MNGKPDYVLRALLLIVVVLLAVHVCIQALYPVGRYQQYRGDLVGTVDTRTGTLYYFSDKDNRIVESNLVEAAKQKK